MFTKTQLFIGGMAFVVAGVGLSVAGMAIKNGAMTGLGGALFTLGLGWLGLQRPADAAKG